MNSPRLSYTFTLIASIVACLGLSSSPADASNARSGLCRRPGGAGCLDANERECGPGPTNSGWYCRSTPNNNCICFNYGKHGWWFASTSDWHALPNVPLGPNTLTTLTLGHHVNNVAYVWEGLDPDPDLASAEVLTGTNDLVGTFQVQIGAAPADSQPARVMWVDLTMASFMLGGMPTGVNHITLDNAAITVFGNYYVSSGILDFNEPVYCILRNDLFPDGKQISTRPLVRPGSSPGTHRFDLSATLDTMEPLGAPEPVRFSDLERISARPNPFLGATGVMLTVPFATEAVVEAFDAAGRLVKRVASLRLAAGSTFIPWDGTDESGRQVPGGTYLIRALAGDRRLATKAIRLE